MNNIDQYMNQPHVRRVVVWVVAAHVVIALIGLGDAALRYRCVSQGGIPDGFWSWQCSR